MNEGQTHWEGCWAERGHQGCAVAEIERLTAERDHYKGMYKAESKAWHIAQARVEDAEFIIRGLLYGPYTHKAEMRGYKFLAVTEQEGQGAVRARPNSTGITDDMIID